MFWASNWFYTYQFNVVNAAYSSVRARALNSILYWLAQMVGSGIFGYSRHYQGLSRVLKAKVAWLALLLLTLGVWGCCGGDELCCHRSSPIKTTPLRFVTVRKSRLKAKQCSN